MSAHPGGPNNSISNGKLISQVVQKAQQYMYEREVEAARASKWKQDKELLQSGLISNAIALFILLPLLFHFIGELPFAAHGVFKGLLLMTSVGLPSIEFTSFIYDRFFDS